MLIVYLWMQHSLLGEPWQLQHSGENILRCEDAHEDACEKHDEDAREEKT